MWRIAFGLVLVSGGAGLVHNALATSDIKAGAIYNSVVSNEIGRALDNALTSFDLPILVRDEYRTRPLYRSKLDLRIRRERRSSYDFRQWNDLMNDMGEKGFLCLVANIRSKRPMPLEYWAARRIDFLTKGQLDLPTELVLGQYHASDFLDSQRVGYYPSTAGEGRMSFFLRSIGWRAGVKRLDWSGGPSVSLYLAQPKNSVDSERFRLKHIFSLSEALEGGELEQWVSANRQIPLDQYENGLRVSLESEAASKYYLTFPPGDWETSPGSVTKEMQFPVVRGAGRQIRSTIRYSLNQDIGSMIIWVLQYDGQGRMRLSSEIERLERKGVDVSAGEHEAVLHSLLELEAQAIRFLIRLEMEQGTELDIHSLDIEQLSK